MYNRVYNKFTTIFRMLIIVSFVDIITKLPTSENQPYILHIYFFSPMLYSNVKKIKE